MEVKNLGLKLSFKKGEAVLSFGKSEEDKKGERAAVDELVILVKDEKGDSSTLRLNKDEAFNMARRVLVGAIQLKRTGITPMYNPVLVASHARLLDDEIDKLIGKSFDIF